MGIAVAAAVQARSFLAATAAALLLCCGGEPTLAAPLAEAVVAVTIDCPCTDTLANFIMPHIASRVDACTMRMVADHHLICLARMVRVEVGTLTAS